MSAGSVLGILILGACHELPPAQLSFDAKTLKADFTLEKSCTPTGVELCFDALDNNCNGIIDEGCGLQTGLLQFTIAWSQVAVDVDLNVSGPDDQVATTKEPTEVGLLKDRDCPGRSNRCYGQNVENVYLADGPPRPGRYRVVVRLEDREGSTSPTVVRLSARVGQRHFTSKLTLDADTQERAFEFSL